MNKMIRDNHSKDIQNQISGLVKQASMLLHYQQFDSNNRLNNECSSLIDRLSNNEVYQAIRFAESQPKILSFWSRRKSWKNMANYLQTRYEQRIKS